MKKREAFDIYFFDGDSCTEVMKNGSVYAEISDDDFKRLQNGEPVKLYGTRYIRNSIPVETV